MSLLTIFSNIQHHINGQSSVDIAETANVVSKFQNVLQLYDSLMVMDLSAGWWEDEQNSIGGTIMIAEALESYMYKVKVTDETKALGVDEFLLVPLSASD